MVLKINNKLKPTKEWIWTDDDPRIRTVSEELDINNLSEDDFENISKLVSYIDACYENQAKKFDIEEGVAITGVQIGFLKRVCYVHFYDEETKKEIKYLVANPKVKEASYKVAFIRGGEGCLSVPQKHKGIVPRSFEITFDYFDLFTNQHKTEVVSGYPAIVLQHEFDHMDGRLYYDRINLFNPEFIGEDWEEV